MVGPFHQPPDDASRGAPVVLTPSQERPVRGTERAERTRVGARAVRVFAYRPLGSARPWIHVGRQGQAAIRNEHRARGVAGLCRPVDGRLPVVHRQHFLAGHVFEQDGHSFAHTMDPRSGRPVTNAVHAVTVRAPTCMLADAWATALLVLGPDLGQRLAAANGIDAMFAIDP